MSGKSALSPQQVRERLRRNGLTLTEWAAQNGFSRKAVYRVMAGQDKGHYGRSHAIAVALGLKVPDEEPSTGPSGGNTHTVQAA